MNLEKFFEMQKSLDAHIEKKHGLEKEDLFEKKLLALLVELGELANETRCFKFWSLKPSSSRDIILEEYVDGVHFILSLGIEMEFDKMEFLAPNEVQANSVTAQFLAVYQTANEFARTRNLEQFAKLLTDYLGLAASLNFTTKEIEEAYFRKNEVNYERQKKGY
jgi:dimeric dUTPase (all-alpha-NTP-PPase superfamily)